MGVVYLNGAFLPAEEACVSVLDRGFLFGDGVYEVIPVYGGRPFRLRQHLLRLERSLDGIRLHTAFAEVDWSALLEELIRRSGGGDQSVYLQVTRGSAKRDHAFPGTVKPTVFAMSSPLPVPPEAPGMAAITAPDVRWDLCNIKAITLLPNVLLRQEAVEAGAMEAILSRHGLVTEGAASNVFVVRDGIVATPPKSAQILPGITRDLVLELLQEAEIPRVERIVLTEELRVADEIWLSSSTREVVPVVKLDGVPVGTGEAGALWARVHSLYQAYKQRFRDGGE